MPRSSELFEVQGPRVDRSDRMPRDRCSLEQVEIVAPRATGPSLLHRNTESRGARATSSMPPATSVKNGLRGVEHQVGR